VSTASQYSPHISVISFNTKLSLIRLYWKYKLLGPGKSTARISAFRNRLSAFHSEFPLSALMLH